MSSISAPDLALQLGLPPGFVPDWDWLVGLVDDEEAAQLLGMKRQSLRVRRVRGDSPVFVRLSNHSRGAVRYRRIDLLRWAAERRHTSTSAEVWPEPAVGSIPRDEG